MKTWQVRGRKGAAPRRRRMTRLLGLCAAAAISTRGGEDRLVLLAFPSFCALSYGSYACLFLSWHMRDLGKGLRSKTFLSASALLADPGFLDQL
jgi:hypothetical protein